MQADGLDSVVIAFDDRKTFAQSALTMNYADRNVSLAPCRSAAWAMW